MSEFEKILNSYTSCGGYLTECDFFQKYCTSPRELAESYQEHGFYDTPVVPYSCNICGLCKSRCPEGLDIGKMMIEVRHRMVEKGIGPLPQHASIQEAQEFYVSDEFKVVIPSNNGETKRIFFPGCSLSAYSPDPVTSTYQYLHERLPGTGIMLGCCGGPAYLTGEEKQFEFISNDLASEIKKVGADEVVVACPCCYSLLKQHHPDLNPVSLYVILDKIGVPVGRDKDITYNIHDPCTARFEPEIQESVRSIVEKAGHRIVEIPHSKEETYCCGMGGMVYVTDAELGQLRSKRTLDEVNENIITYCASCRETLQGQGGNVVHLLDLLFNSHLRSAPDVIPKTPEISTENMKSLKRTLLEATKKIDG